MNYLVEEARMTPPRIAGRRREGAGLLDLFLGGTVANRQHYKLTIIDTSGNYNCVIGYEKALRSIYESWRDATFEDSKKIAVSGFCDDAAQSRVEIAMERESVRGMILEEFY